MAETLTNQQHFYTKDFSDFSNTENNFVANQELTVEITLNEYRGLITDKIRTDSRNSDLVNEKLEEKRKADKLQEQVNELRDRIYSLNAELSYTRSTINDKPVQEVEDNE